MVVASGMTAEYGQQLVDFMYGPLALVALAAAVAGPIVGGLLGERVFKKHFARDVYKRQFTYQAEGSGEATITLKYARSWEASDADKTVVVKTEVKDGAFAEASVQ